VSQVQRGKLAAVRCTALTVIRQHVTVAFALLAMGVQVSLDSHLNLSAGSALGANASETALDVLHPGNSFKRFCYSVSRGVMIDGSWNGAHVPSAWPRLSDLHVQ
jgi:hypothetical protein